MARFLPSPTLLYFSGNIMTTTMTTYYAPLVAPSEASRYANPLRTMLVVVPEQVDPDEPTKLVQAAIKPYGGRAIGLMHLDVPKIIRTDMDLVKVISGLPQKANHNSTETNWTVVFRHSRNEKWTWFITKWMRAGGCVMEDDVREIDDDRRDSGISLDLAVELGRVTLDKENMHFTTNPSGQVSSEQRAALST
ncbi:hypothetical protein YB2330_000640 [Saitoella coloradoensis]